MFFEKRICITLLFTVSYLFSKAQLAEDFSDGDFTHNPEWIGDTANFEIDPLLQLHLVAPAQVDTSYLVTASEALNNTTWNFSVKLDFNPSSNNYCKIYLSADQQNLKGPLNGYFVKVGNTADEISLYRQEGWSETKIIDGTDDRVDLNPVVCDIKVTRDNSGNWELFTDTSSSENFVLEGSVFDANYTTSNYFGVFARYTSTRSTKFYFDNFHITENIFVDTIPPLLDSLVVTSDTSISLYFNEPLDLSTAQDTNNYLLNETIIPTKAVRNNLDTSLVELTFATPFSNGQTYQLGIARVRDTAGNPMTVVSREFNYLIALPAQREEVIINEIFADPTPTVGLPSAEYVELYNASEKLFVLENWKWVNSTTEKVLPPFLLYPDSYVVLCDKNDTGLFHPSEQVIGISAFTALVNGGDSLSLIDHMNNIVDIVVYDLDWYQDSEKEEGGWSLERINPYHACSNSDNWKASANPLGGTPNTQNAVYDDTPDTTPPQVETVVINESIQQLNILFNESIDSTSILSSTYNIVNQAHNITPLFNHSKPKQLRLTLNAPLYTNTAYTLKLEGITDCAGNALTPDTVKFSVGEVDVSPPQLDSLVIIDHHTISISFNEAIDITTAGDTSNYHLNNNIGYCNSVTPGAAKNKITLTFPTSFINGTSYTLTIKSITDLSNNTTPLIEKAFDYLEITIPNKADVVINEIFADPTPSVGLPLAEYVELHNTSDQLFTLENWRWVNSSTEKILPNFRLQPNDYVILCDISDTSFFDSNVIGIPSFPALVNGADSLALKDHLGHTVDAISYNISWYKDNLKEEGGWSLERIAKSNACGDAKNWMASRSNQGGTPGQQNSVHNIILDEDAPTIEHGYAVDPKRVRLALSEEINPILLSEITIHAEPTLEIDTIVIPSPTVIELVLKNEIQDRTAYQLTIASLYDCYENQMEENTLPFALYETEVPGDVVINEILFNPNTGSNDFIELYNCSEKYIDLQNWQLANIAHDSVANHEPITAHHYLISPNDFVVLTKNIENIKDEYPNTVGEKSIEMSNMPSFPDKEGTVILVDNRGEILDRVAYHEDMHFALLQETEGVSLERLSCTRASSDVTNWHSASATSGFATPGYENSQQSVTNHDEMFTIEPKQFSPNSDGYQDVTTISYLFDAPGYVMNMAVYDAEGRLVKQLLNNELLGIKGSFSWDGLNENNEKANQGIYIIYAKAFDLTGKIHAFKKTVVLANQLR